MKEESKVNTGFTINKDIVSMMDEYLDEIGNTNRSKYIEKLIREDLKKYEPLKSKIEEDVYVRFLQIVNDNKLDEKAVITKLISEFISKNEIRLDLNSILDKLSTFGYSSLSKEEKEFLEKS